VQHRHHRRPLTLREEAEMLTRYSCLQRAEYLHEVWCTPSRGPAVAHALQREVAEALTRLSRKVDILTLQRISGHIDINQLSAYYRETPADIAKRL